MQISQALITRGMVSEQDFLTAQSKGGDVVATLIRSGMVDHKAAMMRWLKKRELITSI